MNIQILSDLHLEFEAFDIDHSKADVVVLAGDIHSGHKGVEWALETIKDKPVIYVLGNHEYYQAAYPKLLDEVKKRTANTHIHLLENESTTIGSVTFYGFTLWTDFSLFGNAELARNECQQKGLDYRKIKHTLHDTYIEPKDTALIHQTSLQWLEDNYDLHSKQKNVIISHHAPSARSIPEQYKAAISSASYASNLDKLIKKLNPELWIHGHVHENCHYTIGSTRIMCNPRGYAGENSVGFKPQCIVTI